VPNREGAAFPSLDKESEMSTETGSSFQVVQERGWQRGLGNLLRGEIASWFKSRKGWLQILIWLLIINLILFFATTGLRQVTKAAAAAGEPLPKVGTDMLYGVFVGMLVAFGVMIIARGDIVAERRSGTAAWRATTLRMQGKLDAGKEPMDPNTEAVLLARMLLAQESLERATRLLQRPLEAVETGERVGSAIEILNLQALAFQARGEPIPARAALERALARPEQIAPSQTLTPNQALVEPLSERELEILELVAEGLTNREIASRLYLAVNTVKAHTRNIYGKLGVHSRTQAVARARALGVLASI
jgi:DNA-binding CsgD family transcriptional regulator